MLSDGVFLLEFAIVALGFARDAQPFVAVGIAVAAVPGRRNVDLAADPRASDA